MTHRHDKLNDLDLVSLINLKGNDWNDDEVRINAYDAMMRENLAFAKIVQVALLLHLQVCSFITFTVVFLESYC